MHGDFEGVGKGNQDVEPAIQADAGKDQSGWSESERGLRMKPPDNLS